MLVEQTERTTLKCTELPQTHNRTSKRGRNSTPSRGVIINALSWYIQKSSPYTAVRLVRYPYIRRSKSLGAAGELHYSTHKPGLIKAASPYKAVALLSHANACHDRGRNFRLKWFLNDLRHSLTQNRRKYAPFILHDSRRVPS